MYVCIYTSHFYEVSCFRDTIWYQRRVLACSLRNAYTRGAMLALRERAETVNPETARRGRCRCRCRCACLLSWGNELRSRGIADVTCYGTGGTTRRNRSRVRSIFFSPHEQDRRTSISFCDRRHFVAIYRNLSHCNKNRTVIKVNWLFISFQLD